MGIDLRHTMRRLGINLWIITSLLATLLYFVDAAINGRIFRLTEVVIRGNTYLKSEHIEGLLELQKGQKLLPLNTAEIENRLEQDPAIDHARVSRYPNGKLKVSLNEQEPVAIITSPRLCALDVRGRPLFNSEAIRVFDLPVITGVGKVTLSDSERVKVPEVLEVLRLLSHVRGEDAFLFGAISEVRIHPRKGYIMYLTRTAIPVFLGKSNFAEKLYSLSRVLRHLEREQQVHRVLSMDLRFTGQVVVRQKKHG